ncbi:MAG TPA: hypothetical protein VMK42_05070 [Anaeromyxobacteraceae bacterium]|nr:hypothetical protein [Anaeromyxobacteraceae bacterium]
MQANSPLVAVFALMTAGAAYAADQQGDSSATAPSTTLTTATRAEVVPPPAEPAPPGPLEDTPPGRRILNGHVFMPSATVPGALTTTSFATYLITAYGKTTGSAQIGDKLYSGSFDYAGVGAILGYEYAFLDHFSARFSITELVYTGINGSSALVIGTSVSTGASLGFTASLPIGDSFKLGLLLDGTIGPGLALTIGNGISSIINRCQQSGCAVGEGDIFGKKNSFSVQPALAINWAPWRPFGITANFSYAFISQDLSSGTFSGQALGLGVALDFDFKAISDVPIGLQAVFAWTTPTSGTNLQHVTDLGGGIFYTGRPHLALGLQIVTRRFRVEPNVDVSWSTWLATIGLRYYW